MKMSLIYILLFPFLLFAGDSFISHYEYGEMLYNNPRGISCAECHGKSGKGATIIEYRDIHGKEILKGSDIRDSSLEDMIKAINSYHKVMPRYYLTNKEVEIIYDYIQTKNSSK